MNNYGIMLDEDDYPNDLVRCVIESLVELGIDPKLSGYSLLKQSILYTIYYNVKNINLSRHLYPMISEKYNISVYNVERNIRFAIAKSGFNLRTVTISQNYGILGSSIFYQKEFTNKNYIKSVVEIIKSIKLKNKKCS